ncbi:hypothetical protein [Psychroflexus montanilacus]|uniref:hypothetical protein n=1 Tax=Psychroflexus montanilacus TaxID=2873598 RepID=UPI001CCAC8B3|nr:hypothetical protein [Psychroflexus montanilacus]MBZ9651844.1 hypothetical protein [Psychroflexus montanilacus]
MRENKNTEYIIEFDKNGYVKITDSKFEFHCGIISEYEFIVPIEDIRRVNLQGEGLSNNKGCNPFSLIFNLLPGLTADNLIVYGDSKIGDNILVIRYKTDKQARWVSREISWSGIDTNKVEKIKQILRTKNKKLP